MRLAQHIQCYICLFWYVVTRRSAVLVLSLSCPHLALVVSYLVLVLSFACRYLALSVRLSCSCLCLALVLSLSCHVRVLSLSCPVPVLVSVLVLSLSFVLTLGGGVAKHIMCLHVAQQHVLAHFCLLQKLDVQWTYELFYVCCEMSWRGVPLSWSRPCPVLVLSPSCPCPVLVLSLPCPSSVSVLSLSSSCLVLVLSCLCPSPVMSKSGPCPLLVLSVSCPCAVLVMSYHCECSHKTLKTSSWTWHANSSSDKKVRVDYKISVWIRALLWRPFDEVVGGMLSCLPVGPGRPIGTQSDIETHWLYFSMILSMFNCESNTHASSH